MFHWRPIQFDPSAVEGGVDVLPQLTSARDKTGKIRAILRMIVVQQSQVETIAAVYWSKNAPLPQPTRLIHNW